MLVRYLNISSLAAFALYNTYDFKIIAAYTKILAYRIVVWISANIAGSEYVLNILSLIFGTFEGAFISVLGALAWYAYKTYPNS